MAKQWEYDIDIVPSTYTVSALVVYLNKRGAKGWEAYQIDDRTNVSETIKIYFKREM